jgi:hypothetical protein
MIQRFPSKVDAWLVALLVVFLALPVVITAPGIAAGGIPARTLLLLVLPAALVLWIFTTTYYVLSDDELIVRSGPLNRRIPLKAIVSVRPTRNPLSSPALSLDRLEIDYGKSCILISPKHKEEFLQALAARGAVFGAAGGAESKANKQLRRALVLFVLPLLGVIGTLIYLQSRPPAVDVSEGRIHIRTIPRQDILLTDVVGLTLENRMPRVLFKRNGLNLGGILHGRFALEGVGNAQLYLQASGQPPFVKIDTRNGVIYVNYATPADTGALYERLTLLINR